LERGAGERRRDIQGLRAIAVVGVLAYHTSARALPSGGFVGVDVFFVVSGYLITRILMRDEGGPALADFYLRRARRLLPALTAMIVFAVAAGALLLPPEPFRELATTALAALASLSNVAFLLLTGYFTGAGDDRPLLNTWSLAVEAQFYLFFPLLLQVLRRFGRRAIGPNLCICALFSLALSAWASVTHPTAAFYLAPSRAFELLIGALLAIAPLPTRLTSRRRRDLLSLLGLALIAVSMFAIDQTTVFPGLGALAPCIGAALVIGAGSRSASLGGRLISFAPVVLLGDISYSLYLWHWPLLALARVWNVWPLDAVAATAIACASIPIAYASWRWIETPFIEQRIRLRARDAAGAVTLVGALCAAIIMLDGAPGRFGPRSRAFFAASSDHHPARERCLGGEGATISYDRSCVFGAPGTAPAIAVWSDSHGSELAYALGERLAERKRALLQVTSASCPPVIAYTTRGLWDCVDHNDETLRRLSADSRIEIVLILVNYIHYAQAPRAAFERGFETALQRLRAAGKTVVVFEPIPTFAFDPPETLGALVARGKNPLELALPIATYRREHGPFLELVARTAARAGATVFPTSTILCTPTVCPTYDEAEGVLYFNGAHLSMSGARRLARALLLPEARAPGDLSRR
jgi:peptidoglycan/LPS O-acetylase OafA/YrhL